MNDRLRLALGWELGDKTFIWPGTNLDVKGNRIDPKAACALGLAHRHELLELRLLSSHVCKDTLPLIRAVMAQINGCPMITPVHLHDMCSEGDVYLRKEQIEHLLTERERHVTVEICDAVAAVEAQLVRVSSAMKRVQTWRNRVAELERQEAAGKTTKIDAGLARLDGIDAQSEFLREVVLWKRNVVKLAAVQGVLAEQCQPARPAAGAAEAATIPEPSAVPSLPPAPNPSAAGAAGPAPRALIVPGIPTPPSVPAAAAAAWAPKPPAMIGVPSRSGAAISIATSVPVVPTAAAAPLAPNPPTTIRVCDRSGAAISIAASVPVVPTVAAAPLAPNPPATIRAHEPSDNSAVPIAPDPPGSAESASAGSPRGVGGLSSAPEGSQQLAGGKRGATPGSDVQ